MQSSPDTFSPLTESLMSYLYTDSLRTFPKTLLFNGIHRKLYHRCYVSYRAYKEPCKHPCRCSSDTTRMPKGLFDVCFHLDNVICREFASAIRCICSLSNVSWTIFKQLFLCESEIFQMLADVTLKIVMRSRWCTYWLTSWVIPSYIL